MKREATHISRDTLEAASSSAFLTRRREEEPALFLRLRVRNARRSITRKVSRFMWIAVLAAESQDLLHEVPCPISCLAYVFEMALDWISIRNLEEGDLRVTEDNSTLSTPSFIVVAILPRSIALDIN